MKEKLENIKKKIAFVESFLLGSHSCICCNKECDSDNAYRICLDCMEKIPFTANNYCLRCGEIIKGEYDYCIRCKDKEYDFDCARSVFAYTDFTSSMITNFKYGGYKDYAKHLAQMLKDFYVKSDLIIDVVTFVPMPSKREKERGFNQSKELAKEFCLLTEIPLVSSLERTKENVKQASLNAEQRKINIKGSFKCVERGGIKGKDVLLIDDVMTTGATASECSRVLLNAGARSVQVLTLAKTSAGSIENLVDYN